MSIAARMSSVNGSSPRGRGTPLPPRDAVPPARFIPARAGNTCSRPRSIRSTPVHPRAGGEHFRAPLHAHVHGGSSPRGRGTRWGCAPGSCAPRFIPARAGNTMDGTAANQLRTVHPRAGGEHARHSYHGRSKGGSSPRGRGTPRDPPLGRGGLGFIPARAGNTTSARLSRSRRPVHPRAGGEHWDALTALSDSTGSSPRGRGTRSLEIPDDVPDRFIPARAGNTRRSSRRSMPPSVHPRAGGEHNPRKF